MAIIIHYIAAPFEQSFSYEGTIDDFLVSVQPIRNLINIDKAGDNLFNVTPSGIAIEFKVPGPALYEKLFNTIKTPDPRIFKIQNNQFAGDTVVDNGVYNYNFSIAGVQAFSCQCFDRRSVDFVLEYIANSQVMFEMFDQFLRSVRQDFPESAAAEPKEVTATPPAEEPVFTLAEDQPTPELPVEVKPRQPLPEKVTPAASNKPKIQQLGILVCRIGGSILEVVVESPYAHRLATTAFVNTLKGYLDENGVISVADNGRRVMGVSLAQASKFEDIIRSAIRDHNAQDDLTIGREDYVPGKEVAGRIYL
ncbi:hypothetical protein MOC16_gp011 [Klebsiella phage vB_KpM_FBKp24]|uniref:Uncharacterized protein n=1 Tax=Klebsiella phage vB_KpM_FBKp24 TaxID=2801834 RepID=A0A7U0J5E2_9CAUD|nr:hypothetical protein MOC16_gp011 [Klebsiella phage vB_KpM_FBKp24]QQV92084.1 hypothetical protein vBKpMFBKp24_011 [Klebsiella phage vB_KpM_FBKp24]